MLVGTRQAKIGCAQVPPIERCEEPNIEGYESIRDVFTEALTNKICHYVKEKDKCDWMVEAIEHDKNMFRDCVEQTIHFLKSISALKPAKEIESINLWMDAVPMHPFYEGVNAQLKSMLIKHYFPKPSAAMDKGATYAFQPLTDISEAVLYTMEYFQKEGLLEDVEKVIETEEVKKWVNDYIRYVEEHKDEIEAKEKAREKYRKEERESLNKKMEDLKRNS